MFEGTTTTEGKASVETEPKLDPAKKHFFDSLNSQLATLVQILPELSAFLRDVVSPRGLVLQLETILLPDNLDLEEILANSTNLEPPPMTAGLVGGAGKYNYRFLIRMLSLIKRSSDDSIDYMSNSLTDRRRSEFILAAARHEAAHVAQQIVAEFLSIQNSILPSFYSKLKDKVKAAMVVADLEEALQIYINQGEIDRILNLIEQQIDSLAPDTLNPGYLWPDWFSEGIALMMQEGVKGTDNNAPAPFPPRINQLGSVAAKLSPAALEELLLHMPFSTPLQTVQLSLGEMQAVPPYIYLAMIGLRNGLDAESFARSVTSNTLLPLGQAIEQVILRPLWAEQTELTKDYITTADYAEACLTAATAINGGKTTDYPAIKPGLDGFNRTAISAMSGGKSLSEIVDYTLALINTFKEAAEEQGINTNEPLGVPYRVAQRPDQPAN